MNSVNVTGRLTADPEARGQSGGVAAFRLAVNGRRKDEQGEWVDAAGFFNVVCFGRVADLAIDYLAKGRRVAITGRLSWREWEAQDGGKRQAVEIIANDVVFLDSRQDDGGAARGGRGGDSGWPTAQAPPTAAAPADDDIPF